MSNNVIIRASSRCIRAGPVSLPNTNLVTNDAPEQTIRGNLILETRTGTYNLEEVLGSSSAGLGERVSSNEEDISELKEEISDLESRVDSLDPDNVGSRVDELEDKTREIEYNSGTPEDTMSVYDDPVGTHTVVAPMGSSEVRIICFGAGGMATLDYSGGAGGYSETTLSCEEGDRFFVRVGYPSDNSGVGAGGGNGGGASVVAKDVGGGNDLIVCVAGGGGGAGVGGSGGDSGENGEGVGAGGGGNNGEGGRGGIATDGETVSQISNGQSLPLENGFSLELGKGSGSGSGGGGGGYGGGGGGASLLGVAPGGGGGGGGSYGDITKGRDQQEVDKYPISPDTSRHTRRGAVVFIFSYEPTGTGKTLVTGDLEVMGELSGPTVEEIKDDISNLDSRVTVLENSDAAILEGRVTNLETSVGASETEISNLEDSLDQISDKVDNLEGNVSSLEGRVSTNEGNISTLEGRVTSNDSLIGNLETSLGELTTDVSSLDGRVTASEGNISNLETSVGQIITDLNTNTGDISTLRADVNSNTGEISSLGDRVSNAEGNISDLGGRVTTTEEDISNLATSLGNLSDDLDNVQTNLGTVESDIQTLNGQVTSLQQGLDSISTEEVSNGGISNLPTLINSLTSDVEDTEEKVSALEDIVGVDPNIRVLRLNIQDPQAISGPVYIPEAKEDIGDPDPNFGNRVANVNLVRNEIEKREYMRTAISSQDVIYSDNAIIVRYNSDDRQLEVSREVFVDSDEPVSMSLRSFNKTQQEVLMTSRDLPDDDPNDDPRPYHKVPESAEEDYELGSDNIIHEYTFITGDSFITVELHTGPSSVGIAARIKSTPYF